MRISPLPSGTIDRLSDVDLLHRATNFDTYFLFQSLNVFSFIDFGTLETENG
jgi:hypothetical protein